MAERRSLRRLIAWFVLGLLVAAAAAEASARIAEAAGPPVLRWYDAATQLKVEQMDDRDGADVVFAGTSMVWQGLVPSEFASADPDGRDAYNAGLAGGVPVVMEPWLLEEVVPRLEPGLVVWGLSSMDFSASYGDDNLERYRDALETRTGRLASVEQFTSDFSALVRYRTILRRPSALFGSDRDDIESDFEEAASILGPDGERRDFKGAVGDRRAAQVEARFRNYRIDESDIASIYRTVEALRAAGVEVILVEMPTPDRYADLHPEGDADLARAHETIVAIGDEFGVEVVDLRHGFTDEDFVDFTHLNETAAAALTTKLVAALQPAPPEPEEPEEPSAEPSPDLLTANRTVAVYDDLFHWMMGAGENLRSPAYWYGRAHYGRTYDLVRAEALGEEYEVVFVGSSMMQDAADPLLFTELDGRASFNAALPRLHPEAVDLWLREQAIPSLQPDLVVYGVGLRDIRSHANDDGTCTDPTDDWARARDQREGAFGPIDGLGGTPWESIAFGDPPSAQIQPLYRAEFNAVGGRLIYVRATPEELADSLKDRWAATFEVCGERLDVITGTIEWLTGQGIRVVVVGMPTRDALVELFPEGRTQVDGYYDLIEAAMPGAGVEAYFDFTRLLPDELFRDDIHADYEGSQLFTQELVKVLANLPS